MNEIIGIWPIISMAVAGLVAASGLYFLAHNNAKQITENSVKLEGIDKWTRSHEREASEARLKIAERFATLEKSIEIGMNNHSNLTEAIKKLEGTLEKMQDKFEALTKQLEQVMSRHRSGDDKGGGE